MRLLFPAGRRAMGMGCARQGRFLCHLARPLRSKGAAAGHPNPPMKPAGFLPLGILLGLSHPLRAILSSPSTYTVLHVCVPSTTSHSHTCVLACRKKHFHAAASLQTFILMEALESLVHTRTHSCTHSRTPRVHTPARSGSAQARALAHPRTSAVWNGRSGRAD